MINYRADIDGLRGVAVVSVLLYHAGFQFAGGGYVGVDVFFVISGYLITSLIHGDLAAGRFSVVHFYERRIRRLLPALFVVLAACSLAATALFLPDDLRRYGGSLFSATAFASNFFFWLETGYFQTAAEFKPLIHTWSLAVEEQFYLLAPLLLWLGLRRSTRHATAWVVILLLGSLAASAWAVRSSPSAAFYLTHYRAWELAVGVLLALRMPAWRLSANGRELAGWCGLALIVWSVGAYSWQTPFPGLAALAPCAGAALVIWSGSGGDTALKRILSLRPVVFVGLISYSLYLWHWPILSFARYYAVRELRVSETIVLLAASTVLAAATWRLVERPFRRRDGVLARPRLFLAGGLGTLAGASLGLWAVASAGWPARVDEQALHLASAATDRNPRREECSFLDAADLAAGRACRLGRTAGRAPDFVVWGDSHADALMPAFDDLASRHGLVGLYLGRIGCPPLLGIDRLDADFRCASFAAGAHRQLVDSGASTVFLVARWTHYTSRPTYGNEHRTPVVIHDVEGTRSRGDDNDKALQRGLQRTLESLAGFDVILVGGVPEIGHEVPQTLARIRHLDRDVDIRPARSDYQDRQRPVTAMVEMERRRFGFRVLQPSNRLCDARHCAVLDRDKPLYFDSHHLSRHGATYVASEFEPAFAALARHRQ